MRDVGGMDADFREAAAADAVKTWDAGFRHGRELGMMQGAAVLGGLMAMAIEIQANHDPWYRCPACGSHSLNSGGRCLSSTCDPDLLTKRVDQGGK